MKFMSANRIAPDGTPASHLEIFCLPMSHKKDARLIWVNTGRKFVFFISKMQVPKYDSGSLMSGVDSFKYYRFAQIIFAVV